MSVVGNHPISGRKSSNNENDSFPMNGRSTSEDCDVKASSKGGPNTSIWLEDDSTGRSSTKDMSPTSTPTSRIYSAERRNVKENSKGFTAGENRGASGVSERSDSSSRGGPKNAKNANCLRKSASRGHSAGSSQGEVEKLGSLVHHDIDTRRSEPENESENSHPIRSVSASQRSDTKSISVSVKNGHDRPKTADPVLNGGCGDSFLKESGRTKPKSVTPTPSAPSHWSVKDDGMADNLVDALRARLGADLKDRRLPKGKKPWLDLTGFPANHSPKYPISKYKSPKKQLGMDMHRSPASKRIPILEMKIENLQHTETSLRVKVAQLETERDAMRQRSEEQRRRFERELIYQRHLVAETKEQEEKRKNMKEDDENIEIMRMREAMRQMQLKLEADRRAKECAEESRRKIRKEHEALLKEHDAMLQKYRKQVQQDRHKYETLNISRQGLLSKAEQRIMELETAVSQALSDNAVLVKRIEELETLVDLDNQAKRVDAFLLTRITKLEKSLTDAEHENKKLNKKLEARNETVEKLQQKVDYERKALSSTFRMLTMKRRDVETGKLKVPDFFDELLHLAAGRSAGDT